MNAQDAYEHRGFYRRSDKAKLGGVCAGVAEYFGFNLCVTRFLAVIAFFVAMPFAVIGYIAAVMLIPAYPSKVSEAPDPVETRIRETVRKSPQTAAEDVHQRAMDLDSRLARLEKYVTSSRYQLDREFDRL